jgi:hypothetical protein
MARKASATKKTSASRRAPRAKTTHRAGLRKPAAKPCSNARGNTTKYWSGRVTRESDALDLDKGVFSWDDPKRIATSLKRSALESHRRKAEPYRSALSMLVFYINRAGKNLPGRRRRILDQAKVELRRVFGRN